MVAQLPFRNLSSTREQGPGSCQPRGDSFCLGRWRLSPSPPPPPHPGQEREKQRGGV